MNSDNIERPEQNNSHKSSEVEPQSFVEIEQNLIEENKDDFEPKERFKGRKLSHYLLKF